MASDQNKISRIITLSAVVVLLGACSTAKEIGDGVSIGFGNLGRDISAMFEAPAEDNEPKIVSHYDDRYYNSGYDQLATEMSDTSVQLYGLDGHEAMARPQGREDSIVHGARTNDPSVTVFSLDDGKPVKRGFQPPQSVNNYTSRTAFNDEVPAPYDPPEQDRERNAPAFVPMTRMVPPANARGGIAQYSTMPHRIYFAHDSKELTPSGHDVVDHIATSYQGQNLSVEGHASERADEETSVERKITNLKVSMDRALSVSRALMKEGVPAESIETKAYGDTKPPLAPQGMSTEAAARRVEIISR